MSIFDEARLCGEKMDAAGHSFKGQINVYACTPPLMPDSSMKSGCGYWIVTVDRDTGVTPFMVKCGHCGGMATSRMYRVGEGLEPTHEWFRPANASELPPGHQLDAVADHLRNGGLLMRPIGEDKWLAPTPATEAFVRREQQMVRNLSGLSRQQRRHQERKGRA